MDIYTISIEKNTGDVEELLKYKGRVMLIVNSATACGFTPQYEELKYLHETYHDKGLVILDFPCNQFKNQAPGSDEEIQNFCINTYALPYIMCKKIDVNGKDAHPLFTYLKHEKGFTGFDASHPKSKALMTMLLKDDPNFMCNPDIKWNFTKFLVDRNGNVIDRFEPVDGVDKIETIIKEII